MQSAAITPPFLSVEITEGRAAVSVQISGELDRYTEPRLANMAEITGGTPYGATTLAGIDGSRQPSENELAVARFQGRHVAQVTNALIAGRTTMG